MKHLLLIQRLSGELHHTQTSPGQQRVLVEGLSHDIKQNQLICLATQVDGGTPHQSKKVQLDQPSREQS